MSILSKPVSYYPNINATIQGVTVNLLSILQSNKHCETISHLRQADAETQKQLKENLPCFTVAGTFSRRCTEGLIQPSGLACVDLDSAEDYDLPYLLKELRKLNCIAYAGLSCRGRRLFCIIPFLYPDQYEKHYERLIKSFSDWGLPMGDACHKSISQPRFVSWNDSSTEFFNHIATKYSLLPVNKTYHYPARTTIHHLIKGYTISNHERVGQLISKLESNRLDITPTYQTWFEIGCSLANAYGEEGREYFHRVSQFHPEYTHQSTNKQFDHCLKHSYRFSLGTFFFYLRQSFPSLQKNF